MEKILFYFLSYIFLWSSFFVYFLLSKNNEEKNVKIKEYPKVSIIVPAYNEEKNIEECLNSLISLDYPKDKLEIIVVDDGSTDNTYEIAKKYEKYGVIVLRKKNGGKASALNYGLKYASGEYVAVVDADSVVSPNILKEAIKKFDEKTVAVTAAMLPKNCKKLLEKIQYIEYIFQNALKKALEILGVLYVTPGPFSIYKKFFFEKYGGFDERNITEDHEIALRILSKGYKIKFIDAIAKTEVPSNIKGLIKQRIRWYLGYLDNLPKYFPKINLKGYKFYVVPISLLSIFTMLLILINLLYKAFKKIETTIILYKLKVFNFANFSINNFLNTTNLFSIDIYIVKIISNFHYIFLLIASVFIFFLIIKKYWNKRTPYKFASILYLSIFTYYYAIPYLFAILFKLFAYRLKWGGLEWRNSFIYQITRMFKR